jgi:hypothetical protein
VAADVGHAGRLIVDTSGYTLKPKPTNEFVGVEGLYADGVFERMKDSPTHLLALVEVRFQGRKIKSTSKDLGWLA